MEPVLLAFLLTFAAGGATGIGALLPFFLKNTNSNTTLAICLGLSAGVMIYVSFTEIFKESLEMFEKVQSTKKYPVLFTSLAFFTGVIVCVLLDVLVHFILPDTELHLDPSQETVVRESPKKKKKSKKSIQRSTEVSSSNDNLDSTTVESSKSNQNLKKMSAMSCLAIALHNLPEGMATFFATLSDPKLGASLACAIAIHNIPEGIAVALPVYYATNSKIKAFALGFASGLTEPIGGLIAYYLVKFASNSDDITTSALFAFMFSLVSGMMVFISVVELYFLIYLVYQLLTSMTQQINMSVKVL